MSPKKAILLVDIGNTRIKWARLENGRLGAQRAAAHAGWKRDDFARRVLKSGRGIERILVASVAGAHLDKELAAAGRRLGVIPQFIASQRQAGGITTMYQEPWRLGVDRFVAAIGAYHLAKDRAVCVVDIGTAMTIDLIDAGGRHRGGGIVPGPDLMMDSLLKETSGIARRVRGAAPGDSLFARNTRAAIEQGTRHAVAATVDRAVQEARAVLKTVPELMLTGGAVPAVRRLIRVKHRVVPDLVLRGLAVLAC